MSCGTDFAGKNRSGGFYEVNAACGRIYKCEDIAAEHFFTFRDTDVSALPFPTVRAGKQIHSAEVVYIDKNNYRDAHVCDGFVMNGDACRDGGETFGICIKTSDCTPILLCDGENNVVAALHAGWRGSIARANGSADGDVPGIAAQGIRVMLRHGAELSRIKVAIGACIHSCCFEVKEDFIAAVRKAVGKTADKYLICGEKDGEKAFFYDLPALNAELMAETGIPKENIYIADFCTCCNTKRFFSYRGEGKLNGSLLAAIKPHN